MVEWSQSLQISLIGGAFVFAYIASTINFPEKFNNGMKMLFYLFTIGMVIVSVGINYPILEYEDSALLGSTSIGSALNGIFIGLLSMLSVLVLLIFTFIIVGMVMSLKEKKRRQQYGESD